METNCSNPRRDDEKVPPKTHRQKTSPKNRPIADDQKHKQCCQWKNQHQTIFEQNSRETEQLHTKCNVLMRIHATKPKSATH
jgi:hypothetical protein